MIAWWNGLSTVGQIFALFGIAGTLLLVIQVVLMLIGLGNGSDLDGSVGEADGGFDADVDVDVDGDLDMDGESDVFTPHDAAEAADTGLHVLSVRGIVSFFAVAGWVGLIADKSGAPLWVSLPLAVVCGFAMMLLVAFLMKWLMGLQSDGTADIRNAIGVSGTVYLRVPANRAEPGKVNLLLQGSYRELEAVTDENEDLGYGAQVVVIGVTGGNTLIVKKK